MGRISILISLVLIALPVKAETYLVFPTVAQAEARSAQQCAINRCEAPTIYWWGVIQHPANGQGAVAIDDSGAFGAQGLTASEISALQTHDALNGQGWFSLTDGP